MAPSTESRSGTTAVGDTVRHTQSGNTRSYAVWVLIGAIAGVRPSSSGRFVHPALVGGVR